jgi:hypothetical protein
MSGQGKDAVQKDKKREPSGCIEERCYPDVEKPVNGIDGFWTNDPNINGIVTKSQHHGCPIEELVEESVWVAEVLHTIPGQKAGPISVLVIPVPGTSRRVGRVKDKPETQVPS